MRRVAVAFLVLASGLSRAAAPPRFAVQPQERLQGLRSVWVRLQCAPDVDCAGIGDDVQARLRKAGLVVLADEAACPTKDCAGLRLTLSVGKTPALAACLWNATLVLEDGVTLVRGEEQVSAIADTWTWSAQGLAPSDACPAIAVRQGFEAVDRFVKDYVAGNPGR